MLTYDCQNKYRIATGYSRTKSGQKFDFVLSIIMVGLDFVLGFGFPQISAEKLPDFL